MKYSKVFLLSALLLAQSTIPFAEAASASERENDMSKAVLAYWSGRLDDAVNIFRQYSYFENGGKSYSDPIADAYLGYMYADGIAKKTPQNPGKARSYCESSYRKAGPGASGEACLGYLNVRGIGGSKNITLGLAQLKNTASEGNLIGLQELALAYSGAYDKSLYNKQLALDTVNRARTVQGEVDLQKLILGQIYLIGADGLKDLGKVMENLNYSKTIWGTYFISYYQSLMGDYDGALYNAKYVNNYGFDSASHISYYSSKAKSSPSTASSTPSTSSSSNDYLTADQKARGCMYVNAGNVICPSTSTNSGSNGKSNAVVNGIVAGAAAVGILWGLGKLFGGSSSNSSSSSSSSTSSNSYNSSTYSSGSTSSTSSSSGSTNSVSSSTSSSSTQSWYVADYRKSWSSGTMGRYIVVLKNDRGSENTHGEIAWFLETDRVRYAVYYDNKSLGAECKYYSNTETAYCGNEKFGSEGAMFRWLTQFIVNKASY